MKSKHIVKFSDVATTGLGLFLIVGLAGCNSKSCSKGNSTYTGDKIQECLNTGGIMNYSSSSSTSGSSYSSGYFANSSSTNYHSGG